MMAGTLGGLLANLVHFRAVLLWIGLGCALYRAPARKRPLNCASRDTAAVVGRHPQLRLSGSRCQTGFMRSVTARLRALSMCRLLFERRSMGACCSAAAMSAIFRFKDGMIQTLLACSWRERFLFACAPFDEPRGSYGFHLLLRCGRSPAMRCTGEGDPVGPKGCGFCYPQLARPKPRVRFTLLAHG